MIPVSNSDFARAMRLLRSLALSDGRNRRESEDRRLARLLVRKWEQKHIKQQSI